MFVVVLLAAVSLLVGCSTARTRDSAASPRPLQVVTLNLWHDASDWPARRAMILATLTTLHPDVLFLQEVLQDVHLPNQAQQLADALGYAWRFYSVDDEQRARRYGNAILTPHRIVADAIVKLEPLDDWRCAGYARIALDDRDYAVFVTHLNADAAGGPVRARQATGLLAFVDAWRGADAAIIGGDFNTVADAPELAGIRALFGDAFARASPVRARDPATTTLNPAMGHAAQRIDQVFVADGDFAVEDADILFGEPDPRGHWASDHFGVRVRLLPHPPATRVGR